MNLRAFLLAPLLGLSLSACSPGAPAGEAVLERPPQLGMCASCHGVDGIALSPGNPHLAGQDEAYLRLSLQKYKSGERRHPPMQAVVGALQDADLDALSSWYASQPRQGVRAAAAEAEAAVKAETSGEGG